MIRLLAPILSALVLIAPPSLAQDDMRSQIENALGEAESFDTVYASLTEALYAGDAETIAALVAYPLTAYSDDKSLQIADEAGFIAIFDTILPEATRQTLADQAYDSLFVNAEGVMFGDGEIWVSPVCADDACGSAEWLIIAINY